MALDERRARRAIVAAAALGLIIRLAFGLIYWVDRPLTHDEREYLALAASLSSGRGFIYDAAFETGTAQQFGRAPGYPAFLAALDGGRPEPSSTPTRVKVAQSIVGAATVCLIGLIALGSAGARAGVAAAFAAALYPPLAWIPAYALSEALYCLAALATAFVFQAALDRLAPSTGPQAARLIALAGALAGAAALIRPAMLFFLPVAAGWLLFRRRPWLAVGFVAAAAVVILPWTWRNFRVHDRFVLIASEGGVTFWTGNHPLARGEGDLATNPDLKRAELTLRLDHPGLTPEQLEGIYYADALSWIADHPVQWAGLVARKAFYTVVPIGPSYAVHSRRYRIASVAPYALVLPFAMFGAWRLRSSRRPPVALFLLAGSTILMCLVFFPQERFRIPVIDPTLLVAAAAMAGRHES
jgi:4-amino-4-deoxy-L-arabinose transferase-like glycosyltransferase